MSKLKVIITRIKENKSEMCYSKRIYMGKAKDRVLVVLLSDLTETLPEYAIGPE